MCDGFYPAAISPAPVGLFRILGVRLAGNRAFGEPQLSSRPAAIFLQSLLYAIPSVLRFWKPKGGRTRVWGKGRQGSILFWASCWLALALGPSRSRPKPAMRSIMFP